MTAAAILAGGRGRRMGGVIKPLLVVGGRRIIDRQLSVLRPLFDAVVIVTAETTPFAGLGGDVDIITDRRGPGLGPLGGLDAALGWLPPMAPSIVCVAGDMPFLAEPVLKLLRDAPSVAAVVPRLTNGPQPLCARYHRSLAAVVSAELDAGTRAMHVLLEHVAERMVISWIEEAQLRQLDPDLETFLNINTPDDLIYSAR